jgi:hypothetical protein
MSAFDATRLVRAWELHDRWAVAVSDHCRKDKRNRIPNNGGVDVTARLGEAVEEAAGVLGVHAATLSALIQAERRTDPGSDVAGAIARVIDGLALSVTGCSDCGVQMPNYAIYRDYHAEHCPERKYVAPPIDPRMVEAIETSVLGRISEGTVDG